jgi:formamidopyrimidine-DNA glycosylase
MADGLKMWFKDQLHYGTIRFVRWSTMEKKVLALGPDVTVRDPRFTKRYWRSLIERYRNWDISKLLMDQGKIAGIGNYLKAEILYDSKVAPDSLVGNIPEEYVERLWNSIMELPRHYFILQLTTRFKYGLKVYNKNKDPFGIMCAK